MQQATQSTLWRNLHLAWNDQDGQDMIEYALLAGFVAVAVAAFFPMDIAPNISTVMSKVSGMLNAAPG